MKRLCFHRHLSCCSQEGGVWQTPPLGRHPRWADTPPGQTPPGRHPPGRHPQTDTPWVDTPQADTPQADIPLSVHAGIHPPVSACWDTHLLPSACWDTPPETTAANGTYPTGMHSCSNNKFKILICYISLEADDLR